MSWSEVNLQFLANELDQACHLDILMKTQGEKTKTQEQKNQNSRAKNPKLKDFL